MILAAALVVIAAADPAPRAVYGVFEGPHLNVYAQAVEGPSRARTLLVSIAASHRMNPHHVLHVRVSPRRDRLAYTAPGRPTQVVDPHGRATEIRPHPPDVVTPEAGIAYWSPDGASLLVRSQFRVDPHPLYGRSMDPPGPLWSVVDVRTGAARIVGPREARLRWFGAWRESEIAFLEDGLGWPPYERYGLTILDLVTGKTRPRRWAVKRVPFESGEETLLPRELHISPSGRRALAVLRALRAGVPNPVYSLTRDWDLGRPLAEATGDYFGVVEWSSDDDFFYTSGKWPTYSVRRYSFGPLGDREVMASGGGEVYTLEGVFPGERIAVKAMTGNPPTGYRLELRRLDGSDPVVLASSPHDLMFVGWLR